MDHQVEHGVVDAIEDVDASGGIPDEATGHIRVGKRGEAAFHETRVSEKEIVDETYGRDPQVVVEGVKLVQQVRGRASPDADVAVGRHGSAAERAVVRAPTGAH